MTDVAEELSAAAVTGPDRAAVILDDQLPTHRDLDRTVGRFAGVLSAMGAAAGDRVGLHLPNPPAFPVGEAAELLMRGLFVMADYWNRPVATAEAMLGGWPPTGDIATAGEDGFWPRVRDGGRRADLRMSIPCLRIPAGRG